MPQCGETQGETRGSVGKWSCERPTRSQMKDVLMQEDSEDAGSTGGTDHGGEVVYSCGGELFFLHRGAGRI